MPLNPIAGGRSLDAIWHNPNLSVSEKAVLQSFAAHLNFRGDFLDERHFVLSKWMAEGSLSKYGLIRILNRLIKNGYLNRRITEMGPPDYKKTYYSLTQQLFDEYLGPAKLNSHPDTNQAKLNSHPDTNQAKLNSHPGLPFNMAHTDNHIDNHIDNPANKEMNNDNQAKLNSHPGLPFNMAHPTNQAKLNSHPGRHRARHIKLLQESIINVNSTMIQPSLKNEINEITSAHMPERVKDDAVKPLPKRPVKGISSISSISGILGGALLGKAKPGEHVPTEPSDHPAETTDEALLREACKLRRLVFTNTRKSGKSGKGIVYLDAKPIDASIAGFMANYGVDLVRLVCLNEQQQNGGGLLVYDHALMGILLTEGSVYRHINTDFEASPGGEYLPGEIDFEDC